MAQIAIDDISRQATSREKASVAASLPHLVSMVNNFLPGQDPQPVLKQIELVLQQNPQFLPTYYIRGMLLLSCDRLEEARRDFKTITRLMPDNFDAYCKLAVTLLRMQRAEESIACSKRAIEIDNSRAIAYYNLGLALHKAGRVADALDAMRQATTLDPEYTLAIYYSGVLLKQLQQPEAALVEFEKALEKEPGNVGRLIQHAMTSYDVQRPIEALDGLDRALAIDPESNSANFNKSLILMSLGEYAAAWPLYEFRKKLYADYYPKWPNAAQWMGDTKLEGKRILVHLEQGLGDFIQNCRYTRLLAVGGAKVILQTPDELLGVAASLADSPTIVSRGDPLPDFDAYVALMSLPLAFNTTLDNVPADIPYLACEEEKRRHWRMLLGQRHHKHRIGIVWSGSSKHPGDSLRSIPLALLEEVLQMPCEFHVLQKEIRPVDQAALDGMPQLNLWCDQLRDYTDVAALIEEMELLISVDTSVAHLGGALGKPVWLLLSYIPEYRWLLEGETTPWYPSFRIWRQEYMQGWQPVVSSVAQALASLLSCTTLPDSLR